MHRKIPHLGLISTAPLRRVATALSAAAFLAALAAPVAAEPMSLAKNTCTTALCGSLLVPGRINAHPATPALANVWIGQFNGGAATCLRFEVISQSRDLAMSVVAPNGTTFRNDDGGGTCATCPRVVVGAVLNGFYTVVVANKNALGVDSSFQIRAGLYNSGNTPNCSSPTQGQ